MITYAIMKAIADAGTAGLTIDKDFYWEQEPLQANGKPAQGAWLLSRGGSNVDTTKGLNQRVTIDIYVAYNDKTKTEATLKAIADWIRNNRVICTLSGTASGSSYAFTNVRITPATTPQNVGLNATNGQVIKTVSADIVFDINH